MGNGQQAMVQMGNADYLRCCFAVLRASTAVGAAQRNDVAMSNEGVMGNGDDRQRFAQVRAKNIFTFTCMHLRNLITIDKEILGGQPVFSGTRVPVESLFDHLEAGVSLDEFLEDFPSVSKAQAIAVLNAANKLLTSRNAEDLHEAAA